MEPVEEVVSYLSVDHHASFAGQDLGQGSYAVGHHLGVSVTQHLIENIHKVHLCKKEEKNIY